MIYLGSLSKTLAHGLRLCFMVAPAELIRELRALRRLMMRHVASSNQQAVANFIAHGSHEAHVRRLIACYRDRALRLREALAEHAPQLDAAEASGGSALWVTGPPGLNTRRLAMRLYVEGVVIEPGDVFHPAAGEPCNRMRVGYSSIVLERIEPGVRLMAKVSRAAGLKRVAQLAFSRPHAR